MIMPLCNFVLTNLMLQKQSMDSKETGYQQNYSLWNEIRADYTKWDHKRNEDILDKLKIKPFVD
jgi:predicted glycosyltransferase